VAFSLREAQTELKNKRDIIDSSLFTLGGITRFVGMVIDRKNNDIILIGKKSSHLPISTMDDLVVALRSRLKYHDLPMVSIDPVSNTTITGRQEVRFGGQIQNTSFGNDLLNCDILLKKYSLELEKQIKEVQSYRKLLLNDALKTLNQGGVKPVKITWVNIDSALRYRGQGLESAITNQSRFWFNYRDPCKVRALDDVFCLLTLDIVVEKEVQSINNVTGSRDGDVDTSIPDEEFANEFSNNYYTISETYPVLKKIKLLFDMTAIAEGLNKTKDIPDISFLLNEYEVKKVDTREDFELISMCAIIERSDGKINLIRLSGGITPEIEMEWLNAGDVTYLRKYVLESRPNSRSLFWKVNVDNWEMPNNTGIRKERIPSKNDRQSGCIFNSESIVLSPVKSGKSEFMGFPPVKASEPYNTKGVQMNMIIDNESFISDSSLNHVRDTLLKKNQGKKEKVWRIRIDDKK